MTDLYMHDLNTNDNPKPPETLWGRYRSAFDEWASEVDLLSQAQDASESRVLMEAQRRTTAAEANYRESRERLTDSMARPAAAGAAHLLEPSSPQDRLESK